jgi:hypothetical protein
MSFQKAASSIAASRRHLPDVIPDKERAGEIHGVVSREKATRRDVLFVGGHADA